jgi:RHS repeat-associated protein
MAARAYPVEPLGATHEIRGTFQKTRAAQQPPHPAATMPLPRARLSGAKESASGEGRGFPQQSKDKPRVRAGPTLTHQTLFTNYDGADRPRAITLPDASQVLMTYDRDGNVASVTPPGKSPHGMTYGPRGRIESYTPPVGNAVSFQYDLDRRMDLIDFGLDAFNQPNQVDFEYHPTTGQLSTITSPTGTINVGFENGHMTSLSAPSISGSIVTSIAYDGFLPTTLSWAGPVAGEVNWTYNDRFLIATETIGALPATTVNYSYDDDGLVTQAGGLAIARDPANGRVVSKTIGNIRESFAYNEFAELSRQTVELMNGTSVVETLYDVVYDDNGVNGNRDALGRITKKTEWIVSGDVPNGDGSPRALDARTYDYGYNPEGRPWLESVAVDGAVVSSYGYDDNGNRTSVELNWSQLGYDASFDASLSEADTEYDEADKLLHYGTKAYSWNAFGQLSSMTDSANGETTAYEYDLFGNLLSVALPDGRTIEYEVDGAGRRVGRRELDVDGNEISFRGWIYRDLLRPIAEVDALGNVVARYVYSDGDGARQNGIDQLSTRLGANQDTSLGFSGSNVPEAIELLDEFGAVTQTLALSINQVGSVQLVTDAASGDVAQRIEYDEFGRVVFDSAPGTQPFGFAGGIFDTETELVRFGARDYSPTIGRWLRKDPIRLRAGHNGYQYVYGDPIGFVDSTGFDGGASAAATAGAIVGILCTLWYGYDTVMDALEFKDINDKLAELAERSKVCGDDFEEMGDIEAKKNELELRAAKLMAGQPMGYLESVFVCAISTAAAAAGVLLGS